MSDTFRMRFFVTFSTHRFYGIMGTELTGTSHKFIHYLHSILKERFKQRSDKTKPLIIVLDNSNNHKTKEAVKFIFESNIPMFTILSYEPILNPV